MVYDCWCLECSAVLTFDELVNDVEFDADGDMVPGDDGGQINACPHCGGETTELN